MKRKSYTILLFTMILLLVGSQIVYASPNSVTNQNIIVLHEYQSVKDLTQKSPSELKSLGLTDEEIKNVANIDTQYKDKLAERSKLSPDVLKSLGYTDAQIAIFKAYKGTEGQIEALSSTLTIKPGLGKNESKNKSSQFSVQSTPSIGEWVSSYSYSSSTNKTTADIALNWSWDSCPIFEFWDVAGFSWSGGFIQTSQDDVNNYVGVTYYKSLGVTETYTHEWDCSPGTGCQCSFEMCLDSAALQWAQSGYAKARIYTDGKTSSLGLRCGYGHQTLLLSPYIGFDGKGGMGFSTGVTSYTSYHVYTL